MSRTSVAGKHRKKTLEGTATTLPLPDYFGAKGMLRDSEWVDAYLSTVLQWPKKCTLSTEDRQLVGLAKALAFSWEPGILNHTDLALNSGSSSEVVTEVLRTAAIAIGLADLDRATRGMAEGNPSGDVRMRLEPVREYFGALPRVFRRRAVLEDGLWLQAFLKVASPAYESRPDILHPRLRALVSLAAVAVTGWDEGVRLYGNTAKKFGATNPEVSDVVKSIFKTGVSNAMAAGFRTPCHIPRLEKYRTILSAYVDAGALAERRPEPLQARSSRGLSSKSSS